MSPLYMGMGEVEGELDFVSAYFLEKQRITMNNEHHRLYLQTPGSQCLVSTLCPCARYCVLYRLSGICSAQV